MKNLLNRYSRMACTVGFDLFMSKIPTHPMALHTVTNSGRRVMVTNLKQYYATIQYPSGKRANIGRDKLFVYLQGWEKCAC